MLETFIITLYVTDFDKGANWFLAEIYKKKNICNKSKAIHILKLELRLRQWTCTLSEPGLFYSYYLKNNL
jgi:hypothetical protein